MKLSIVIPVYNEASTVLEILEQVKNVNLGDVHKEIVLVNDGSSDGSAGILNQIKKENPTITTLNKETNEGKGAALRDGFKLTTGDYVIVQDADLEYDPQDYPKLLAEVQNGSAQVVYGSRFQGAYEDMTSLHYWGNKFLTFLTNLLFGVVLTDMETCYKLIPGNFVRELNIKSRRFNFEPEITAKILKSGMIIKEVPINYKGRSHTEGKKITWRDGFSAVYTLVKFRFVD